jgi:hypothetical protein
MLLEKPTLTRRTALKWKNWSKTILSRVFTTLPISLKVPMYHPLLLETALAATVALLAAAAALFLLII